MHYSLKRQKKKKKFTLYFRKCWFLLAFQMKITKYSKFNNKNLTIKTFKSKMIEE